MVYNVSPFAVDADRTGILTITAADDEVFTNVPDITATNSDSVTSVLSNDNGISTTSILSNIDRTDATTAITVVNTNIATASLGTYADLTFEAGGGSIHPPRHLHILEMLQLKLV